MGVSLHNSISSSYQTATAVAPQTEKTSFKSALATFRNLEKGAKEAIPPVKKIAVNPPSQKLPPPPPLSKGPDAVLPTPPPPSQSKTVEETLTGKVQALTKMAASTMITGLNQAMGWFIPQKPTNESPAVVKTEAEEIQNRSGHLWICTGRKPDKFGGYIYNFKLRNEYDDVTKSDDLQAHKKAIDEKNDQIFPAVERSGIDLLALDPKADTEKALDQLTKKTIDATARFLYQSTPEAFRFLISENQIKASLILGISEIRQGIVEQMKEQSQLGKLGYEMECRQDGVYLNLPDREALLGRWEQLRKELPELPKLDLVSSEGIASDLDFIEAYLKHDALLSTGKEFVHDSLVHLVPTLSEIMSSGKNGTPSYKAKKEEITKKITEIYQKIISAEKQIGKWAFTEDQRQTQTFKKVETSLSALVDTIAAAETKAGKTLASDFGNFNKAIWENPMWRPYLENRYGFYSTLDNQVSDLWKKIDAS